MKGTDALRAILDIIDSLDSKNSRETEFAEPDSEQARICQIADFLNADEASGYNNTPNEIVASVDSVTTHAGGGVNAPKHVDDIRVKDPRGYE